MMATPPGPDLAMDAAQSPIITERAVIATTPAGWDGYYYPTYFQYGYTLSPTANTPDDDLIDLIDTRPAGKSGKNRVHYGISDHGALRLKEECLRLNHVIKIANAAGLLENPLPTDIQRLLLNM